MTNDPERHEFLPASHFIGWRLDHVATPARCEELIQMLSTRGFEQTGARYPGDYRNNDRIAFDDPDLAASLYSQLRDRLPTSLAIDGETWTLADLNPRFRACRYAGGQSFCIHRDGAYAPDVNLHSHLTLQLYLDDVPTRVGGNTRFYADPRGETAWASVAPSTGTAILFDHRVWHDGEAVTAGIKHVLRTDVMYRRQAAAISMRPSTDDRVLYRHNGYAWHVIVCRDGSIASAGRDGIVQRWSDGAHPLTAAIDLGAGSVTRLVEAADGRLWCGTRAGALFTIDGLRVTAVGREDGAILALAARPDGGVIAATALGTLVAFERNGFPAWSVRAHEGWAWTIVRDGAGYLSAGHDGKLVALDDLGHSTPVASIDASLRALAVSGDELWCGDSNGTLHCVGRSGNVRTALRAHRAAITGLACRRDGSLMSCGEDGAVRVWSGDACTSAFDAGDFVTSVVEGTAGELVFTSYDGAIYRQWPTAN